MHPPLPEVPFLYLFLTQLILQFTEVDHLQLLFLYHLLSWTGRPAKKNSSFDHITLSRRSFSSLIFHNLWVFIL